MNRHTVPAIADIEKQVQEMKTSQNDRANKLIGGGARQDRPSSSGTAQIGMRVVKPASVAVKGKNKTGPPSTKRPYKMEAALVKAKRENVSSPAPKKQKWQADEKENPFSTPRSSSRKTNTTAESINFAYIQWGNSQKLQLSGARL